MSIPPAMMFRAAAELPPTVLLGESLIRMPSTVFPEAAVPAAFVPI